MFPLSIHRCSRGTTEAFFTESLSDHHTETPNILSKDEKMEQKFLLFKKLLSIDCFLYFFLVLFLCEEQFQPTFLPQTNKTRVPIVAHVEFAVKRNTSDGLALMEKCENLTQFH